jgi:hypothetical protein
MTALLPFLLLVTAPAPAPAPTAEPAPVAESSVPHPLRLSLWSTSAFGVTHAKFFNQLAGARLDYRFTSRFAFGGSLAYANLKGKDGRVHNVLPEVSTEYRVPLQKEAYGMPLRLGLGFLPKNGPTMRLGAGLDFAVADRVWCEIVPFEAMVWLTRERPEVSLDASLALRVAF